MRMYLNHSLLTVPLLIYGFSMCLFTCSTAQVQTQFEREIVSKFKILQLPTDSVQKISVTDTLDKKAYNTYLKNTKEKRPVYIYEGKRELETEYYALLDITPSFVAQFDKNRNPLPDLRFYDKAYPLGRIELQPGYYSLVVKVFSLLSTFYDIHNFTKEGKLLSVVPLYSFENARGMQEKVGVLHVKSSLSKDGKIYWWEYYPRRTRERIYILNREGYFEVISENTQGKLLD
jgi:hypothetical protein